MTDTPTVAQAYDALRARLAGSSPLPVYWQNENNTLPDTVAPFAFALFTTFGQQIASYGGGRGANRWRTQGDLEVFVFVPVGNGLAQALDYAEQIAALFRGQRFDGVSCEDVVVDPHAAVPSSLLDASGNYYAANAVVAFYFDQIG